LWAALASPETYQIGDLTTIFYFSFILNKTFWKIPQHAFINGNLKAQKCINVIGLLPDASINNSIIVPILFDFSFS
jgi:hypothetical protein